MPTPKATPATDASAPASPSKGKIEVGKMETVLPTTRRMPSSNITTVRIRALMIELI
jgi:hypothetical protein